MAATDIADAKPTKDQDDEADRLEHEMKICIGKRDEDLFRTARRGATDIW